MSRRRKGKELSMRKVGEIFRLSVECGKTNREIARSCGVSHTVVNDYLRRAREAGLSEAEIVQMSEAELNDRLKAASLPEPCKRPRPQADWRKVYEELKKKSVTLALLWEEYKSANPEGYYRLSQFCE